MLGQTFATLTDEFPIDGKSTIKLDIQATWNDPVDDLSDSPQPVTFWRGGARVRSADRARTTWCASSTTLNSRPSISAASMSFTTQDIAT